VIEQPADALTQQLEGYVWIDLHGRPQSVWAAFLEIIYECGDDTRRAPDPQGDWLQVRRNLTPPSLTPERVTRVKVRSWDQRLLNAGPARCHGSPGSGRPAEVLGASARAAP
jgi:hypothetical protein